MRLFQPVLAHLCFLKALAVASIPLAIVAAAYASENTLPLRINYLAYPVEWNGKTIMIGSRLQLPPDMDGKLPAVILMHGAIPD